VTQREAEFYMKFGYEIVYNGIIYRRITKILLAWDPYEEKMRLSLELLHRNCNSVVVALSDRCAPVPI